MPHIDQMIESRYLKTGDLDGVSGELDVTIKDVREEELRGDDGAMKSKWVCYFEGVERGLVLNKTNLRRLADLLGSKLSEQWVGKRVRLYLTTVPFRGEEVQAIRIKYISPDHRPSTESNAADEIPF